MKRGLMYIAFAIVIASCGNSGTSESNSDTLSPISADTGRGTGDTTGLNVGAAQPIDSNNRLREPMGEEPGAKKSGVYDQIDTGTRRGVDTGTRSGGQQ
jgi:hypothetical protein